jgi:hypothetical protein
MWLGGLKKVVTVLKKTTKNKSQKKNLPRKVAG